MWSRDAADCCRAAFGLGEAQAGVDTMSAALLDRLGELLEAETKFSGAATALGHVLFLYCHDEAFGTNRLPRIGPLLAEAFRRSLWLLDVLGQSAGDEGLLLRGMKAMLETVERIARSPGDVDVDRTEFVAVLQRVERDRQKPAAVRGAAAGMLVSLGESCWSLEEQILEPIC